MASPDTNRPLVSIGLPVFNGAQFIRAGIESLLAQECADFELIISNNASTDETESICREFAARDHRVRVISQARNIGAIPNFGAVLGEARGEFFMWAAADDRWHPQFIARLVSELHGFTEAGVALSAVRRVTEEGGEVDCIRLNGPQNPNSLEARGLFTAITSPPKSKYNLYIYGLYRRALLARLYPSLTTAANGDRIFVAVLALCTRFRYVDEVLQTRMIRTAPLAKRYPDEQFVKMQQRGLLGDLQTAWHLGKSVLRCDLVPWRRKFCALPGMLGFLRLLRDVRNRQKQAASAR